MYLLKFGNKLHIFINYDKKKDMIENVINLNSL